MTFKDNYTTTTLISLDTKKIEEKKTVISNEAYLNAEMIESLINKIESVVSRLSFIYG